MNRPPTSVIVEEQAIRRLHEIPSVPLLLGETPMTHLSDPIRIAQTRQLQIDLPGDCSIAVKRDDLTSGFGNKTRKLELIFADVLAKGADCVLTAGGPQSNHCRQTAQFGRALNLDVHLMFGTHTGERDFPYVGNQVVDRLLGAEVHTCKKTDRVPAMDALATTLRGEGKKPYVIPVGGSNFLGTLAYAKAFLAFLDQCRASGETVHRVVVATSSGGTQAGLVVGARLSGWHGEILGISIDQVPDSQATSESERYVEHMVTIANEALAHLTSNTHLSPSDFDLDYDYLQDGYGIVGDYDRIGVQTLANHGILSGPVYSGRAFGALLDLISKGSIPNDGATLFWHTGGAGELEFYRDSLFPTSADLGARSTG